MGGPFCKGVSGSRAPRQGDLGEELWGHLGRHMQSKGEAKVGKRPHERQSPVPGSARM